MSDLPDTLPSALEVAREFLALAKADDCRDFTTWKLQKLLYRAQCLSEYERARPLFSEQVKAWENGPVVPAIFHQTKGLRFVPYTHENLSKPASLSEADRELVHAVWTRYKRLSGDQLSDDTHEEEAYKKAWATAGKIVNRSPAIKPEDMRAEVERSRRRQLHLIDAFMCGMESG